MDTRGCADGSPDMPARLAKTSTATISEPHARRRVRIIIATPTCMYRRGHGRRHRNGGRPERLDSQLSGPAGRVVAGAEPLLSPFASLAGMGTPLPFGRPGI